MLSLIVVYCWVFFWSCSVVSRLPLVFIYWPDPLPKLEVGILAFSKSRIELSLGLLGGLTLLSLWRWVREIELEERKRKGEKEKGGQLDKVIWDRLSPFALLIAPFSKLVSELTFLHLLSLAFLFFGLAFASPKSVMEFQSPISSFVVKSCLKSFYPSSRLSTRISTRYPLSYWIDSSGSWSWWSYWVSTSYDSQKNFPSQPRCHLLISAFKPPPPFAAFFFLLPSSTLFPKTSRFPSTYFLSLLTSSFIPSINSHLLFSLPICKKRITKTFKRFNRIH